MNKVLSELKTGKIKIRKKSNNKTNKDFEFPMNNPNFVHLVNEIFLSNDINIIIVYQIIFELGLSLIQLSKMKVKNIKNEYKNILFKNKGTQIYKALSFYSSTLLKYHIVRNSLNEDDFIIFSNIKSKKKEKRCDFIKEKISLFLNEKLKNNPSFKKNFISIINMERKKYKINRLEIGSKTKFFSKIWNYLNSLYLKEETINKSGKMKEKINNNNFLDIDINSINNNNYCNSINEIDLNNNISDSLSFNRIFIKDEDILNIF